MKFLFLPEVRLYLQELMHILYYNNYFGSEESSEKYVRELWADILTNLPIMSQRVSPPNLVRHGSKYIAIRKNKQTHWYVFFNEYEVDGEIAYQIRHITNNHVIAQYL